MPSSRGLVEKIERHSATVGVIGLGYVGLPLALAFAEKGFTVLGFDIDPAKVTQLAAGQSYISDIAPERIAAAVAAGLTATANFETLRHADAVVICVPTPLGEENDPDLSFVTATTESVAAHLRSGQLVVLTSTSYPGTTRELVRPILESYGLKSGTDFFLAFSPEREDPGSALYGSGSVPRLVGGDGDAARDAALALFRQVVVEVVPVSSMEVAEAAKLTENVFRAVNIALVNELKGIYTAMGIDIWEVVDAARTKPFGFMPFYPGPGLGGHCIPIDPFYLSWRARQVGQNARFIELAGEINTDMPGRVIAALRNAMTERLGKSLKGARVLLIGLAYKKNVNDTRESPALVLIELLEAAGAIVDYHDPFIPEIPPTRHHAALHGRHSVSWQPEALGAYDAALICTDHDGIDYAGLVAACLLVVDTRNATRDVPDHRERIVKA